MKISKSTRVRIVSSGYDDRFLRFDSTITVAFARNNHSQEVQFADDETAITYLVGEYDYILDDAITAVMYAPVTMFFSGKYRNVIGTMTHCTRTISDGDLKSIQAALLLRKQETYTKKAVIQARCQLEQHPLSGRLLKIYEWQMAECARKSKEAWGK